MVKNFLSVFRIFFIVYLLSLVPLLSTGQVAYKHLKPFKFELDGQLFSPQKYLSEIDLDQIKEAQSKVDSWDVKYWNASYPSYRWHQILINTGNTHKGHKNGGRVAIMHLAIYDAMLDVWKYKKQHLQNAPYKLNSSIQPLGGSPWYSTFICEWSATAGAAHSIISYYFPEQQASLDSQLTSFKRARLATGLQFPSDIARGIKIGKEIAEKYIAYAKTDRTYIKWKGTIPNSDSLWTGKPNPWGPTKSQWKPLTLEAVNQFRPSPPPTDWSIDMQELRDFNATHESSDIAWKWKSEPIWDNLIERKILEYQLHPLEATYANAVFHTARFDAVIAAWDGKYHYMGIRPFQYDPSFKPILIDTPNFPGYPAGHTTVAGSLAEVLAYLFPKDKTLFYQLADECSESRFEGGVHFRTDNEVGLEVGYQVGKQVIKTFSK